MFGEFAQMIVTGADFDPGVGDANQRLGEIVVLQSGGSEHRSRPGATGAIRESGTARF
jgi:hypothetical protein